MGGSLFSRLAQSNHSTYTPTLPDWVARAVQKLILFRLAAGTLHLGTLLPCSELLHSSAGTSSQSSASQPQQLGLTISNATLATPANDW